VSPALWIAIGVGVLLVLLFVIGIWFYPRDNSF
jgi:hypothetical protein